MKINSFVIFGAKRNETFSSDKKKKPLKEDMSFLGKPILADFHFFIYLYLYLYIYKAFSCENLGI